MIVTIGCIHRTSNTINLICSENNDHEVKHIYSITNNQITCKFSDTLLDTTYKLPSKNFELNDVLNFSEKMQLHHKYECILELGSFRLVELNTNHDLSIRGYYFSKVPLSYVTKYEYYKSKQCIDIGTDIILISDYNNILFQNCYDGQLIEIIPQSSFNLLYVQEMIL